MNDTFGDEQFEQFIKLLDAALASKDKKIKTALRKFMFIMALNLSDDDCEPGPFTKMMDTMNELQRRLAVLESPKTFTSDTYTQTWPYGTTATPAPYVVPSTTGGTTQWMNIPTSATTSNISITGNTTTAATNSILGGTNCWTTGTSTFTININDEDTGTEIKNEIKDSLAKLAISK